MRIWLQKKVLIPLIFSPPEFPPVPSSYRAWRCVSWTGFPLFQVPGNLALALPRGRVLPASQAQWLCLCRLSLWAESWVLPDALAWVCCAC